MSRLSPLSLSLHDALPICRRQPARPDLVRRLTGCLLGWLHRVPHPKHPHPHPATEANGQPALTCANATGLNTYDRSEEHTSELQSHVKLVCRLLLETFSIR